MQPCNHRLWLILAISPFNLPDSFVRQQPMLLAFHLKNHHIVSGDHLPQSASIITFETLCKRDWTGSILHVARHQFCTTTLLCHGETKI